MLKVRAGDLRYDISKIKRNYKLTPCSLGCEMFLDPPGCLVTLFQRATVPQVTFRSLAGGVFAVPNWHRVPFLEGFNFRNTLGFQDSTLEGLQGCWATRFGELDLGKLQEKPNFALVRDTSKAEPSQVLLVGHHHLHTTKRSSSQGRPTPAAMSLSLIFLLNCNPRDKLVRVGVPIPTNQPC